MKDFAFNLFFAKILNNETKINFIFFEMIIKFNKIFYLDSFTFNLQRRVIMNVKVDFTCLICSKIFKSPFSLPCGDTICEEHLKETQVLRNNSIKCKLCGETFVVKNNQLIRQNKALQNLIQKELFLSDAEKTKKKSLEKSLRDFLNLNEQLQESKNIFDLDCYNHFQEIRRKIDVQREELKDQIDKISFKMLDELKAIEETYSIRIKEFHVEAYDLEKEKNILNETFRDVNLLISSINQLQVSR
jgi:hypothetical protein